MRPTNYSMLIRACAVTGAITGLAVPCGAQCLYEATLIEGPPTCGVLGNASVFPRSINEHATVVGFVACLEFDDAFVWTSEDGLQLIPIPGAVLSSQALDVNDSDSIVGTVELMGDDHHSIGFLHEAGRTTLIQPPPGGNFIEPLAINNDGIIVGRWGNTNPKSEVHWGGFVLRDGEFEFLNDTIGAESSRAVDISSNGHIAGYRSTLGSDPEAFHWRDGSHESLGPIPNGIDSRAICVNDLGHVCAEGGVRDEESIPPIMIRSAVWRETEFIDLGVLPDRTFNRVRGMNRFGSIVGFCNNPGLTEILPYLWRGGEIVDVNDLVAAPLSGTLSLANDVNNSGQILATVLVDGTGLILTPSRGASADLTGDCETNEQDLIRLLQSWHLPDPHADFDGDGRVGFVDLSYLLSDWSIN